MAEKLNLATPDQSAKMKAVGEELRKIAAAGVQSVALAPITDGATLALNTGYLATDTLLGAFRDNPREFVQGMAQALGCYCSQISSPADQADFVRTVETNFRAGWDRGAGAMGLATAYPAGHA